MVWALVAALVAVPVGVFLVRPHVGGLFKGDFQGIKTEAILGPVITLTVFLTAIVIAQATQTFQRATAQSAAEAGAVGLMYENAGLLPDGRGEDIQATSVCYARAVVNHGWPAMKELRPSLVVDFWADQLRDEIPLVLDGPGPVTGQLVTLNRSIAEARGQRLYDAAPHLPLLTIVLMTGGVLTVVLLVSSLAVPDMKRRVLVVLAGSLAVLLGSTLFLVEQLEEPFTGIIKVEPKVMAEVARATAADFGGNLPCDTTGAPAEKV